MPKTTKPPLGAAPPSDAARGRPASPRQPSPSAPPSPKNLRDIEAGRVEATPTSAPASTTVI